MAKFLILKISNRYHQGVKLQEILTEYGCEIKTRLGIHETGEEYCSAEGIIVLELIGEKRKLDELQKKLGELDGVTMKYVEI